MPDVRYVHTDFYVDFGRQCSRRYMIGALLSMSDVIPIGFHRDAASRPFAEEDRRTVSLLLPHLQRALQMRTPALARGAQPRCRRARYAADRGDRRRQRDAGALQQRSRRRVDRRSTVRAFHRTTRGRDSPPSNRSCLHVIRTTMRCFAASSARPHGAAPAAACRSAHARAALLAIRPRCQRSCAPRFAICLRRCRCMRERASCPARRRCSCAIC